MTTTQAPPRAPVMPIVQDPAAIRAARLRRRMTQAEIATRLGISPSLMSEIEAGTRNAGRDRLVRIARILGVRVADLTADVDGRVA